MNINTLLGNNSNALTGNGTPSSQVASTANTGSSVLSKAHQRLQADVAATTAQLSKFGLFKSAVSDSQTSAKAMSGLASTASAAEMTVAMASFFNAFNATVSAASNAAASPGAYAATQSVNRVSNDFKKALGSDPATQDAMKKLGLSIQKDGTLAHDAKKFADALLSDPAGVQAAMASIGKKVEAVANKELATGGTVNAQITALTQRNAIVAKQQKAMLEMESALAKANTAGNSFAGLGLSAYKSNSSGY